LRVAWTVHLTSRGVRSRPSSTSRSSSASIWEDRHTLGRPQDDVEGGDGVAAMGSAEELAGCRVPALEHRLEPAPRCFALQPEAAGAGAIPPSWTLAVAGQVRFVVGGQLAGVILLPPHRQLRDVGHHPAPASSPSSAPATHPWCIALLGKWFGVRVRGASACSLSIERVIGCGFQQHLPDGVAPRVGASQDLPRDRPRRMVQTQQGASQAEGGAGSISESTPGCHRGRSIANRSVIRSGAVPNRGPDTRPSGAGGQRDPPATACRPKAARRGWTRSFPQPPRIGEGRGFAPALVYR
jgi:hypothetical protein